MGTDDRISGFYRATSGNPCPACLGVAGTRFATDEIFPIHGSCSCTAEPILEGIADRHSPPDGREIAQALGPSKVEELYGAERADVLAGTGSLDVLVEEREAHAWGAMLFAAPVTRLSA
jgi:hypothetical protein